jgi:hypothetical protein
MSFPYATNYTSRDTAGMFISVRGILEFRSNLGGGEGEGVWGTW